MSSYVGAGRGKSFTIDTGNYDDSLTRRKSELIKTLGGAKKFASNQKEAN